MSGKIKRYTKKAVSKVTDFVSGDIVMRRGFDKQVGFMFYCFVLICAIITWSLIAENDLVKVKTNEKTIEELRISYQQMELDYIGMNNRTRIDKMLEGYGSSLHAPVTPPQVIEIQ